MKILITIIIIVLGVLYIGYFCKTEETFLDLGSSKLKIVTTIIGVKSTEIRENNISRFLTSHGINYPETWQGNHFYRGG